MTLGVKDVVYLLTFIVSLISILISLKGELRGIKGDIYRVMDTLYGDKGKLNVVDVHSCKCFRDDIFTAIRRGESAYRDTSLRMEKLNDNIIAIMVYLQIKPIKQIDFLEQSADDEKEA